MTARHTVCYRCGQDIEGLVPYPRGEWRDRGNNAKCASGKHKGQNHTPEHAEVMQLRAEVAGKFRNEIEHAQRLREAGPEMLDMLRTLILPGRSRFDFERARALIARIEGKA